MSEITTKREPQSQTMTWLLVAIWVIAGLIGLLFVEYSSFQVILLTLTGGLVVTLLLVSISQELSINRSKYFVVIPAILIGLWLAAQILFNGLPTDSSLLGVLVRWKNYLGVVAVLVGALYIYKRIRDFPRLMGIFLVWLLFVVVAAISMLRYDYFNWALITMYIGWIAYVTIIIPNLAKQRDDWLILIKLVLVMALVPLILLIIMGALSGDIFFVNPNRVRVTFVFNEPHKYAQFLAVCLVGLMVIIANSKSRATKLLLWVAVIVLTILIILSDSRNIIAFIVVFGISLYLYKYQYKRIKVWVSLGLVLLFSTFLLIGLGFIDPNLDIDSINKISSNRIYKFDELAQEYLVNAPILDILFGTSFQVTFDEEQYDVRNVQRAVAEDRYQRAHIENMYYQIGLSHGLVGLITFLIPIGYIYLLLHKFLQNSPKNAQINLMLAIASINALLVQSLFTDTIPSFGNVLSIFLPLLWIPPLIHLSTSRESPKLDIEEHQA